MTGTELTRVEQATSTLVGTINRMRPEIERALPKHLDPDRIARIATTIVRGNDKLAMCTPESFLGALMTASQLGLEPGPLGEAYLVPYGRTVTFIAGYRGLIKLAYQSGLVRRIGAHVVREHDEFDFGYGLNPYLTHKPKLTDRGKAIAVYGAATLHDGETPFVVLSVDEIERLRNRSRASDNGPWRTDWDAMARKTAIRQLSRWLPMSTDLRNFGLAVAMDGATRVDPTGAVEEQPLPELEAAEAPGRTTAEEIRQQAADRPPAPDPAPADYSRGGATADDTPASPPAHPGPSAAPPAEPEPSRQQQLTAIAALLTEHGVTERAVRLEVVSRALGDKCTSMKDLTRDEADTVLARLRGWKDVGQLDTTIDDCSIIVSDRDE